ncbi:MAG TPA: NAD-dependent epimerase/dehydratase family protein [Jatrophihabitantaceae bacterium]
MRVAVAGGTGLIGSMVVDALRANGDVAVRLARSTGADLVSGVGVDEALAGADAVIDVANVVTLSERKAVAFFETTTRTLLAAGRRAGVGHLVALSIVGIDRVPTGYYVGKLRQEAAVLSGAIPSTVLRATQFHEFAQQALDRSTRPFAVIPAILCQPVAAQEVAEALVRVVHAGPQGFASEVGGPEQLRLPDMVRQLVRASGLRRPVLALRLPGKAGRAMASGALLPTGAGRLGQQTYAEWLAARVSRDAHPG